MLRNQTAEGRDTTGLEAPGHREASHEERPSAPSGGSSSSSSAVHSPPLPPPAAPPVVDDAGAGVEEAREESEGGPEPMADVPAPVADADPVILGTLPLDQDWPFVLYAKRADPVGRRPLTIDSATWQRSMNPVSRLDCVNYTRKKYGMRVAPDWTICDQWMRQEYRCFLEQRKRAVGEDVVMPLGETLSQMNVVGSHDAIC